MQLDRNAHAGQIPADAVKIVGIVYRNAHFDQPTSSRRHELELPSPVTGTERALLVWAETEIAIVCEQAGDLRQMQPRFGEVAGGLGAAFAVDDVLTPHTLVGQPPLQRPRMHREFVGDGLGAALPGGQRPTRQLGHPVGQRRGGRKIRRDMSSPLWTRLCRGCRPVIRTNLPAVPTSFARYRRVRGSRTSTIEPVKTPGETPERQHNS